MAEAQHTPVAGAAAEAAHPVPRRGLGRVWALSALLTAVAVVLLLTGRRTTDGLYPAEWWVAVAIAIGFGLGERFVFHVEFRREAMSFSLSEVPTVFALAFLGPVAGLVVRVVGSLVVLVPNTRPQPYKLAFNAAWFAAEVMVAYTVADLIVTDPVAQGSGRFLVAAAVATGVTSLVGTVVVNLAISCVEPGFAGRLRDDLRAGGVIAPVIALTSAAAVSPALFGIEYAVLSIAPVAAVWLVLARFGQLGQAYRDLGAVHGFAGAVGTSLELDDIVPTALERVLDLVRAHRGALVVFDVDGGTAASATGGDPEWALPCPHDPGPWAWAFGCTSATGFDVATLLPVDPAVSSHSTGVVVPVRSGDTVLGLLVVDGKVIRSSAFDRADRRRLDALADQLGQAVAKALMHSAMAHAALHDSLTGDPNRALFERAVHHEVTVAGTPGRSATSAVLMLDLDEFKEINDTLGHHVGDRALLEFAERLRGMLEPDDLLARFGGDEFAILARRDCADAMRAFADRILARSHVPLALDGYEVVLPVSVGVAIMSRDDRDAASVLRRADIAMYVAKRRHTGVELYRDDIDRRTPERLALVADLRDVIDRDALTVHFQPKLDLATGTVVGAEALCRWQHPTRGWVPPDEFIKVAEETGLIRRLTDQIVSKAIAASRRWCEQGIDLTVAVNLSTLDLLDDGLPGRIEQRLTSQGVGPERIVLEITESALMADTPRTMAIIDRLHRLGVQLSLDDFGTGYSSLSYLRRLPVSELKIDRGFVANLLLDAQDEVIVRSTVELGHNLGLRVVAEGVETEPVMQHLRSLGCDLGQGFGISRPLDVDAFERWLATSPFRVRPALAPPV
jgi:diguanylate cyclase (GGDEF)-like protein